jgi:hypothetical protein
MQQSLALGAPNEIAAIHARLYLSAGSRPLIECRFYWHAAPPETVTLSVRFLRNGHVLLRTGYRSTRAVYRSKCSARADWARWQPGAGHDYDKDRQCSTIGAVP